MQKVGPGSRGPEGVEQRSAGRRGHWVRRSLRCTADDNRKAAADSKQKSAEIAPGPSWAHRWALRAVGGRQRGEGGEDESQAARRRERGQNPPLWKLVQSSGSLIPRYRLGQGSRGISITSRSRGPIMRICSVQNTVSIICQPIV